MPPKKSQASGRRGNPKVRTGCITCKIRKVKCDEAKPSCLRCLKTGRTCDGYRAASPGSRSSLTRSPVSSPELESVEEVRAFDFFRVRAAFILSGNVNSDFWSGLVLRLCSSQPSVRHAVLAISSLHEHINDRYDGTSSPNLERQFALLEYGKAMAAMRAWSSEGQSAAVPLLVCVLFICIEFLLRHQGASQLHICQGRKILSNLGEPDSPSMAMIKRDLVPVFARLGLASHLHGNQPAAIPLALRNLTSVPAQFASFNDAKDLLYHLLDEALTFTAEARGFMYNPKENAWQMELLRSRRDELLSQLGQWHATFSILVAEHAAQTPSTEQHLLLVLYHSAWIWLQTSLQTDESAFDAHIGSFSSIISHSSTIINTLATNPASSQVFSFETEVIAPLYWTAIKCRHPMLRRAALGLLCQPHIRDRRENIWLADEAIAVASRIIRMEEDWLSSSDLSSVASSSSPGDVFLEPINLDTNSIRTPLTEPPTQEAPWRVRDGPVLHVSFGELLAGEDLDDVTRILHASESLHSRLQAGRREKLPAPLGEGVDPSCLVAPFGVAEQHRVRNTLIGRRQDGGVWITTYRDPKNGEMEWDIGQEFIRV